MGLINRCFLALLLLALTAGCTPSRTTLPAVWSTVPPGSFLSTHGESLDDREFSRLANSSDFILVGESHTNPCDHSVKVRIIDALVQSGKQFAIGLEMLPVSVQPVLDRFNARQIAAADLGKEVDWEKLWGYPYSLYQPIFEAAERHQVPVAALNVPRETLIKYRDQGNPALNDADRLLLPRRIIGPSPAQQKALTMQAGLHSAMRESAQNSTNSTKREHMPATTEMTERFFMIQSLWDSMMAEQALLRFDQWNLPVLILAGGGHVEHGWGIEYRLRTLRPDARCLGVMPVRDAEDFALMADPGQRPMPGSAVFFYCAAQHKSRLGMNIIFEADRMRIQSVDPDSAAARAGLLPDDVLVSAGNRPLVEATDLHFAAMAAARQKKNLELTIQRGEGTRIITLPLR